MLNRQWKIWRDDFLRYYSKTSLIMRIVIGAGLSFGVAWFLLEKQIKPVQKNIKELSKKIQEMTVVEDVDLTMRDLQNRERKLRSQLQETRETNKRKLAERSGGLTRAESGKTILELRLLVDRNELKILSEERIKPIPVSTGKSQNVKKDTRVKLVLPDSMDCESYTFKVLGSYKNLQRFFLQSYRAEHLFFLNNVKLYRSKEMITDRDFHQYKAIECSFEAHIPFQKEGKP